MKSSPLYLIAENKFRGLHIMSVFNSCRMSMLLGTTFLAGIHTFPSVASAQTVELPQVQVTGELSGKDNYFVPVTTTATKTDTPLRDVPQSVTIVTRQLIKDTSAQSIADVVRYVPGVTPQQGEGHRDAITIRGQSTTADFFVDSIRDDAQYYRDTYNVERVELLKGSNAMIFGRGGGGGILNRVLKQADGQSFREVTLQGGMFGNKRLTTDMGARVSDTLALRFNGLYENSDSFRNFVHLQRYGINPTLTWSPLPSTQFRLTYEFFHDDRVVDRGVPSFQGRPFDVSRSTFFGNPDSSPAYVDAHILSGVVEHTFDSGLKVKNQARYANYRKFYQNVFPGAINAAATLVNISAYNQQTNRENIVNQTDWTYKFHTDFIKHTLLFGTEFGQQNSFTYRQTGFFTGDAASINVPLASPTTFAPVGFRMSPTDGLANARLNIASVYLQDQIELTPWLQLIGGARYERFDLDFNNQRTGQNLNRVDNLVSPRAGLVFKPTETLSIYGSYSISYLPSAGDQFSALSNTTINFRPEKFTNREIGMKWDVNPVLAATAAVYQLDRENTTANDPNNPGFVVLTGSSRTEGFEAGLTGYILPQWQIAGGYGHQNGYYTSDTTNARRGAKVPQVAADTFSLWNRYQFNPMWGAGVGVIYQSHFYPGADNTVRVPGFARVDAALFWKFNDNLRGQVNIENVLDTKYISVAHSNNNLSPGSPRAVRVSLTANF